MLFLAQGSIRETLYMAQSTAFEDMRLVEADNVDEAERKYTTYWESKSEEHGDNYMVRRVVVTETIK